MIEADLIVCQYYYCAGYEEEYHESTIAYNQKNFLFVHSDNKCWIGLQDKMNIEKSRHIYGLNIIKRVFCNFDYIISLYS